jgi:hypoxanthine phosphoribosyltransferase
MKADRHPPVDRLREGSRSIKPLITKNQIHDKVAKVANSISRDYVGKPVTTIWIFEGALFFYTDLMRLAKLDGQVESTILRVRSYEGTEPGEMVLDGSWLKPELITGRNVLLIDDILDTGRTLTASVRYLERFQPAEIKTCVLLRKPSRLVYDIEPSYYGFDIDDVFVVGYGLDYNGKYRHLRFITTLDQIPRDRPAPRPGAIRRPR